MAQIFIYILADYNAGKIIGEWVDLDFMNPEDLEEKKQEILKQSQEKNAEELGIADYDNFYGLSPSFDDVLEVNDRLDEYGEAYAIYAKDQGIDLLCRGDFEESYCGHYDSFLDYAEGLFDECYLVELPEHLRMYIDYKKFANDLIYGGDFWNEKSEKGGVHIFSNT